MQKLPKEIKYLIFSKCFLETQSNLILINKFFYESFINNEMFLHSQSKEKIIFLLKLGQITNNRNSKFIN